MKRDISLYKPVPIVMLIDLLILVLSALVMLEKFPFTTNDPYEKYDIAVLVYIFVWMLSSYLFRRYRPLKKQKYLAADFRLFYVSLITFGILWLLNVLFFDNKYSFLVNYTYSTILFGINFLFLSVYYAVNYAVEYEKDEVLDNRAVEPVRPARPLDDDSYSDLRKTICEYRNERTFELLSKYIDFRSGNTTVLFTGNLFSVNARKSYTFSHFVQLCPLNDIRGINKMFFSINQKLPDDGVVVCCFETKSTRKSKIMKEYPAGINTVMYTINYILRRVLPKIFITRRLYYDITKGKNRILSKTEVMGRLYYAGFDVIDERKISGLQYVFAKRIAQPNVITRKNYGPLIKLKRKGKNAQLFDVYKFRTMYPYSEYLQAYIYKKNSLRDGGKFARDIRITSLGAFMRKYWLDELPMLLNLLKGEMKIVGVRPLSNQYFSLYNSDLQALRTQFKPGLLPPFYADMPRTLDEIQASEMKYLNECKQKGVFFTDIKYFFKIVSTILFKNSRSA